MALFTLSGVSESSAHCFNISLAHSFSAITGIMGAFLDFAGISHKAKAKLRPNSGKASVKPHC